VNPNSAYVLLWQWGSKQQYYECYIIITLHLLTSDRAPVSRFIIFEAQMSSNYLYIHYLPQRKQSLYYKDWVSNAVEIIIVHTENCIEFKVKVNGA
jgi:hypothetical protein